MFAMESSSTHRWFGRPPTADPSSATTLAAAPSTRRWGVLPIPLPEAPTGAVPRRERPPSGFVHHSHHCWRAASRRPSGVDCHSVYRRAAAVRDARVGSVCVVDDAVHGRSCTSPSCVGWSATIPAAHRPVSSGLQGRRRRRQRRDRLDDGHRVALPRAHDEGRTSGPLIDDPRHTTRPFPDRPSTRQPVIGPAKLTDVSRGCPAPAGSPRPAASAPPAPGTTPYPQDPRWPAWYPS